MVDQTDREKKLADGIETNPQEEPGKPTVDEQGNATPTGSPTLPDELPETEAGRGTSGVTK